MDSRPPSLIGSLPWEEPYAWAGLLAGLATLYLMAWLSTRLVIAIMAWPARRSANLNWYEQARLRSASRGVWLLALMVFVIPTWLFFSQSRRDPMPWPPGIVTVVAATLILVGVLQASLNYERQVSPSFPLCPHAMRNLWANWVVILFPVILQAATLLIWLPNRLNATAILLLIGSCLVTGLYLAFGWSTLMRWLGILRPAGDRLQRIAKDTAEKMGYAPRRISEFDLPVTNAYAFTITSELGVTSPAMTVLDDEELASVCAHEIAHLRESRLTRWCIIIAGFLIGILISGLAAAAKPLAGEFGGAGFGLGFFGTWTIVLIGCKLLGHVKRGMEHRADAEGKDREEAPDVYARALEKIVRTNLSPVATANKNTVYPDLYDRMLAAGVTPEYPRPKPPPQFTFLLSLFLLVLCAAVTAYVYYLVGSVLPTAFLWYQDAWAWSQGAGLAPLH